MLCDFDADSLRCLRCGFLSEKLPQYRQCQTIEEMARSHLDAWAHGRIRVPPVRLGSIIAAGLNLVGVTEERVKKMVGDCGCSRRKNTLDAAGESLSNAVSRVANKALDAIVPHPVTEDEVAALAQSIAENPLTNRGLKERAAGR
jgi:hypothetical protein